MNELLFLLQLFLVLLGLHSARHIGSHALVSFIAVCAVLANLFVLKQISLFGLSVTTADALSVGSMLALTILQEHTDAARARTAIAISFFALIFYTMASGIQVWYTPLSSDQFACHYQAVLQYMPRLTIASLIAYGASHYSASWLFALLKQKTTWGLPIRTYSTVFMGQLVDTLLFTCIGLYGLTPHLTSIMLFSFTIKIITLTLATPLGNLYKKDTLNW